MNTQDVDGLLCTARSTLFPKQKIVLDTILVSTLPDLETAALINFSTARSSFR